MDFDQIMGNERAKRLLSKAVEQRSLSHAYLFYGPSGVGKLAAAYSLACYIVGIPNVNPWKRDDIHHPDLSIITADGNVIKIDQIRSIIQSTAYKPVQGDKKVFIIDEAERMTQEASNALLKTLEEPPEFMTIILVSDNHDALLPTIKSRCGLIPFGPLPFHDTKSILRANGAGDEQSDYLAKYANGSPGVALRMYRDTDFTERRERLLGKLLSIPESSIIDILTLGQALGEHKEYCQEMTLVTSSVLRDLLMCKTGTDVRELANSDKADEITTAANSWKHDTIFGAFTALAVFSDNIRKTRGNLNYRLALESFLLSIYSAL